jgi:hypothetical protein
MHYKIIEAHQEFSSENKLLLIAVLWQSNERGWVRASYCTTKHVYGYKFLLPGETINDELIQEVAGSGMNLPDDLKEIFFPNKKGWEQ